jgi:hypothetical protein
VGGDLAPGSVSQAPERRNLLVQERDVEARSKIYSYWYELVEDYTRREITKATDRLPAIAGLAQQVAKRLPEDLYIMGLWLSDLSNGLLWTTTFPVHQEPSPELAPSWSWLSQDGRAEYDMPRCDEIEAYEESKAPTFFFLSTIDKDVSPFPLLRVLASLVRVKCVECVHEHENDRYQFYVCDERIPLVSGVYKHEETSLSILRVYWDQHANDSYIDATFHCLILGNGWEGQKVLCGLVLRCVDPKTNLYRRMGVFYVFLIENNAGYWSIKAFQDQLHGLEREGFYIK